MAAQEHPVFKPPINPGIKIWRYMSLAKFVWLIQNEALYFCRSDLMGDPFEGHYSRLTAVGEDAWVAAQLTDEVFRKMPDAKNIFRRNYKKILSDVPREKLELFISCWHMNEAESLAMWKLYAARDDSICVQSTYQKLATLLPSECFLGTVKYIDYDTEFIDVNYAFNYIVHKRNSFEHERELRAVIWPPCVHKPFTSVGDGGLIVPVTTNDLVERIFITLMQSQFYRRS